MWWHGSSVAPLSPVYLVLLFWYWIQTGSLDIVTHVDSHSNTKFLAKDSFKCSTIVSICNLYHSQQAGFCSSLKVQLLPKFQVPSAKYSPVKININHFKNRFNISFQFFFLFPCHKSCVFSPPLLSQSSLFFIGFAISLVSATGLKECQCCMAVCGLASSIRFHVLFQH